jgi:hypothetical protein
MQLNSLVDTKLRVREAADKRGMSVVLCYTILTVNITMHCVTAKFIPPLLTSEQQEQFVAICQELLHQANDKDDFLTNIVTGDETWFYGCDFKTGKTFLTVDIKIFPETHNSTPNLQKRLGDYNFLQLQGHGTQICS